MNLLPDEHVIGNLNGMLVLTTQRIRYDRARFGHSHIISITLNSIASCQLVTKTKPLLLLISACFLPLSLVCYMYTYMMWSALFVLGLSLVPVALYFNSRRAMISIASSGGTKIHMPVNRMNRDSIVAFIDAVEQAKMAHRDI